MFAEYVFRQAEADYHKKLLLIDADSLDERTHYSALFEKRGFIVIQYRDDLHFRAEHDDVMQDICLLKLKALSCCAKPGRS